VWAGKVQEEEEEEEEEGLLLFGRFIRDTEDVSDWETHLFLFFPCYNLHQ